MKIESGLRLRILALALATTIAASSTALGQQLTPGPYVSGSAGAQLPGTLKLQGDGVDENIDRDVGAALIGSVGYAFPDRIRVEAEANWRRGTTATVDGVSSVGHVSEYGGLGNVLYDIPISESYTGYVGAGVGVARVGYTFSPSGGTGTDDSDVAFAYQGIAGIAYNLNSNLALTADYRYFRTTPVSIRTESGARTSGEYDAHTLTLGLRYSFEHGTSVASPVAARTGSAPFATIAAAQTQSDTNSEPDATLQSAAATSHSPPKPAERSYVVFFAFDKSDLTPGGRMVIEQAAAGIRESEVTLIRVTGHADRVGTEEYNFRLSLRRANVVKAELIRLGIAPDQMEIAGKGMADPAVETPPGVREARNRRVEITF
ncbi:MAG TPA: outer membrane beta-barrel protein [Alphaproteobacteria bacterium]|nr:outer membrane beta-barrel protein [Alphaproteobacteria bacterium]